jgi:hypothetical protein
MRYGCDAVAFSAALEGPVVPDVDLNPNGLNAALGLPN